MQFNQPDTVIQDTYNPMDWNRFSYARYNALRYTDPTGHTICDEYGFCYDHGKLVKGTAKDYFLTMMLISPIHDEKQNDPKYWMEDRSPYCPSADFCPNVNIYHPGLDIGNAAGTDVYAVAPGIVVFANWTSAYGWTVIIEHDVYGEKFYSLYAHLGNTPSGDKEKPTAKTGAILVKQGDKVTYSSHIGEMGNSKGDGTTSAHLHLEVRTALNVNRAAANPINQYWIYDPGLKADYNRCSPWQKCWLDISKMQSK